MSETTTLTVRIDPALKEKLKNYASEKEESLSQVVAVMLDKALSKQAKSASITEKNVDNQLPETYAEPELSSKEIKALRKLLRKK